jgi:phosphoglycolate phosphatase
MREIELMIFDLDGTLVDSRQDIVNGINFMLKELGQEEQAFNGIISYVGKGVEELIKGVLGSQPGDVKDKALGLFKQYYKQHPADHAYVYPGVEDILNHFHKKEKVVITNRNHKSSIALLEKMGLAGYFRSIIGDDNTSCLKPSSCQFDRFFAGCPVRDRYKTIMIGDMDIDILAGKASGIITCAVTYGIGREEDIKRSMPDYIIDHIAKLKEIII